MLVHHLFVLEYLIWGFFRLILSLLEAFLGSATDSFLVTSLHKQKEVLIHLAFYGIQSFFFPISFPGLLNDLCINSPLKKVLKVHYYMSLTSLFLQLFHLKGAEIFIF